MTSVDAASSGCIPRCATPPYTTGPLATTGIPVGTTWRCPICGAIHTLAAHNSAGTPAQWHRQSAGSVTVKATTSPGVKLLWFVLGAAILIAGIVRLVVGG